MDRVNGANVKSFVYIAFSALNFISLLIKVSSFFWYNVGTFHTEDLSPALGIRGHVKNSPNVFLAPAVFLSTFNSK